MFSALDVDFEVFLSMALSKNDFDIVFRNFYAQPHTSFSFFNSHEWPKQNSSFPISIH